MTKKANQDNTPIMLLSILTLLVMMVPMYFFVNSKTKITNSSAKEDTKSIPSPTPENKTDPTLKVTM